jgi:hypothetical protein
MLLSVHGPVKAATLLENLHTFFFKSISPELLDLEDGGITLL